MEQGEQQQQQQQQGSDFERARSRKLLRQIAELERWRAALERRLEFMERTRERLEAAVQAAPVGLIGVDALGVIQLWNRGAEALLGYPARRMIGCSAAGLDGEMGRVLAAAVTGVLRGDKVNGIELALARNGEDLLSLRVSGRPITSAAGVLRGGIVIVGASRPPARAPSARVRGTAVVRLGLLGLRQLASLLFTHIHEPSTALAHPAKR